ncbi:Pex19 protein [Auriculariales sp. MPI-PUGE-AT-0066]|nr:Pex19 protein [Auriculariales sp. MPI-PUGE-AT-0066]
MSTRPTVTDVDDDLDDLDDVLDQFSSKPAPASQPTKQPQTEPAAPSADPDLDDEFSEELMHDLAQGMETLMRDLMGPAEEGTAPDPKTAAAEWEKTLKGLHDSTRTSEAQAGASGSRSDDAQFQATLQATLDKLKESEQAAKAGDAEATESDDLKELQDLFAALGAGGQNGPNGEPGQLPDMFEGLLQQLMSKEILYEPLRDLSEKYPGYIKEHRATIPVDDLVRYEEQSSLVSQIVASFERPDYSDDDPTKAAEVLRLMNEMQAKGSPPQEIMGDMPPGWNMGPDGLPALPDNCTIA